MRAWTITTLSTLAAAAALALAIVVVRIKLWRQLPGLPHNVRGFLRWGWRIIRPTVVLVAGMVLVLGGLPLIPLPGPGILIVFAGLALLATEFVWARALLKATKDTAVNWSNHVGLGVALPPNAGLVRRVVFRWSQMLRRVAERLGLTRLAAAMERFVARQREAALRHQAKDLAADERG
ncbi:MAG: PGPGW domain-containing protein [Phycisphaeraceae bacterium]